ncbi:MAG TPA: lysophospholipid acyltransferase family protein [Steroidobacteraceae bacterium]|nr:lysophospholipid acyltransferase family protein [Steroidobacteraceae bacterium]
MKHEILPEQRVSTRRLTPLRRLAYALLAPLLLGLIRLWWSSCRVVRVVGAEHLEQALAAHGSLLPCYWHQHELFCGRYLLQQRALGLIPGFLISPSVDGEVPAWIATRLGARVIRGSSTRTGARALRDYYRLLVEEGVSPVITPDGPTGPRFRFKPGALLLAQLSGRPLLPMAFAASRAWTFGWDRFVLPWPFSRIAIAVGAPVRISRDVPLADEASVGVLQRRMEEALHEQFKLARGALR